MNSTALSTGCCQEEGFAGKLFREMLEEHKMYVASGHFRDEWHRPGLSRMKFGYRPYYLTGGSGETMPSEPHSKSLPRPRLLNS